MERDCKAENKLDTISAVTLGSLCAYIIEFGSPHQKEQTSLITNYIRGIPEKNEKYKENEIPDWDSLRQRLYSISGYWLWSHATNHWRYKVAPQMNIPPDMLEQALQVDKSLDEKEIGRMDKAGGGNTSEREKEKTNPLKNEFDDDMANIYFEEDSRRLECYESKNFRIGKELHPQCTSAAETRKHFDYDEFYRNDNITQEEVSNP